MSLLLWNFIFAKFIIRHHSESHNIIGFLISYYENAIGIHPQKVLISMVFLLPYGYYIIFLPQKFHQIVPSVYFRIYAQAFSETLSSSKKNLSPYVEIILLPKYNGPFHHQRCVIPANCFLILPAVNHRTVSVASREMTYSQPRFPSSLRITSAPALFFLL